MASKAAAELNLEKHLQHVKDFDKRKGPEVNR